MNQLTLDLTPPRLDRAVAMHAAMTAGEAAMGLCEEKSNRVDPLFVMQASQHMMAYLRGNGVSSGELLTDSCKLARIRPTDDRHFGPVIRSLIRRGVIRYAGECRRAKGHATRGGSLYELVES